MSISAPEAQDALFAADPANKVPASLARATSRLQFPPSYVLVGVYRLITDKVHLDLCKAVRARTYCLKEPLCSRVAKVPARCSARGRCRIDLGSVILLN